MSSVKKPEWVDPCPFVIRNIESGQVVARAATKVLAEAYFKDSLNEAVPSARYRIETA